MMQKTVRWLLVIWFCLSAGSAHGRIGETLEQCKKRYGPVVSKLEDGDLLFLRAGYVVSLAFYKGKVESLFVMKETTDILGTHKELSDDEIRLFLKANRGTAKNRWIKIERFSFMQRKWRTTDGSRWGLYSEQKRGLMITANECVQRSLAKEKAETEKRLRGF